MRYHIPRYEVFKLGTDKLKYYDWNLTISKKEAFLLGELIPLFEGQEFRLIADILQQNISQIDFSKYLLSVVLDSKKDFRRMVSPAGITVNGIHFRRFVGTTGGLKNNTLLFANSAIIDELNRRCECGRNPHVPLVPAKYEAYKALTCSASRPIPNPERILVVRDCITHFTDTVISLDDTDEARREPAMTLVHEKELTNNVSDGFGLCTIQYMDRVSKALGLDYVPGGICLRNAWFKGMLYPFPIMEFVEQYGPKDYLIRDIWGNLQDIRRCEMIVTESSLKLWSSYQSIDDYLEQCAACGYTFAVTKIAPKKLEDVREINYQYLQSYDFTDEEIGELCSPTVRYLKEALCGDYESTVRFLGLTGDTGDMGWQQALCTSPYMMKDPYVIDAVHRMIRRKIDEAKIGKLRIHGNYQLASGDPFALMQHVCGLPVTGLLDAGECYSSYWNREGVGRLTVFRSPMTSHHNIRKCVCRSTPDTNFWYQYMDTILIINSWDTFCMAENGCDYDSDILFSTDNPVLQKRHRVLPAIECVQRTAKKVVITEKEIIKTNKDGMGNDVGSVTNHITAMMEVQSHFDPESRQFEKLDYRIMCGQLYQQNTLDKLKGILSKSMPPNWYQLSACGDDPDLQAICAHKKPYFMIYIYGDTKKAYRDYMDKCDKKCRALLGTTVADLLSRKPEGQLSEAEETFFHWYERKMPVGTGPCSMNRICRYVEGQFDGYTGRLKADGGFDYTRLKVRRRCTELHRRQLRELAQEYGQLVSDYKKSQSRMTREEKTEKRQYIKLTFRQLARELCPDGDERLNILLDLCYGEGLNRQFFWDCAGDLMIKRLEGFDEADSE